MRLGSLVPLVLDLLSKLALFLKPVIRSF